LNKWINVGIYHGKGVVSPKHGKVATIYVEVSVSRRRGDHGLYTKLMGTAMLL
jgi:hypothetical protein